MKIMIISLLIILVATGFVFAHNSNYEKVVPINITEVQNIGHHVVSEHYNDSYEFDDREQLINGLRTGNYSREQLQEMMKERMGNNSGEIAEIRREIMERNTEHRKEIMEMRTKLLEQNGLVMIPEIGNPTYMKNMSQIRKQIRARHLYMVKTKLRLSRIGNMANNKSEFIVMLNNGKNSTIKIMPKVASQEALERLKLKNCNETFNCSIELKEVGNGNNTQVVYEARARKMFRLFGIFKIKRNIMTQIDADTGRDILTERPWWSWMATENE